MNDDNTILRRIHFKPYISGPTFELRMWDTGRTQSNVGSEPTHYILGYTLHEIEGSERTLIFQGEDFGSPLHQAIDSYDAAASLMGFLTLRPGDTDASYFEGYTPRQLQFVKDHGEILNSAAYERDWKELDLY